MTSGAIQAYVPAALILVVRCHSRARPKSVIFRTLLLRSPFSTFWRISTGQGKEYRRDQRVCINDRKPCNTQPSCLPLGPPAGSVVRLPWLAGGATILKHLRCIHSSARYTAGMIFNPHNNLMR